MGPILVAWMMMTNGLRRLGRRLGLVSADFDRSPDRCAVCGSADGFDGHYCSYCSTFA